MINPEELEICKRRGHVTDTDLQVGWQQCTKCGTWVRELRTIEERVEEPPEAEWSPFVRLQRQQKAWKAADDKIKREKAE